MGGLRAFFERCVDSAKYRTGRHPGMGLDSFYDSVLRTGDLVFDVGANRGEHAAAMLRCGARVVALEPQAHLADELRRALPSADVVPFGASDVPGEATLITTEAYDFLATLNPAWTAIEREEATPWRGRQTVQLTTLDDLISRFGVPAFVKIDTEGFEDRVLGGLSRPIDQLLFEVASGVGDVAARAFERLARLGNYEYRLMECESWRFGKRTSASAILRNLPYWGNVYARRR